MQNFGITGYGLNSSAGNQDFALIGAVNAQLSNTRPHSSYTKPIQPNNEIAPVLVRPASKNTVTEPTELYIQFGQLGIPALRQAINYVDESVDPTRIMVITLLPSLETSRGTELDSISLKEFILEEFPDVESAKFLFLQEFDSALQVLQNAIQKLKQGDIDVIVFGGIDSLINDVTWLELVTSGRVMALGESSGLILGEAAAYIVIENNEEAKIKISSIDVNPEPNSKKADRLKMSGLQKSIQNVVKAEQISADLLQTIILTFGAEIVDELEWYQTKRQVWPRKLPEQQRIAMQLGEIESPKLENCSYPDEVRTHYSLGEVGAASIPIALVLSYARTSFNFPKFQNILLCETSDQPWRAAVFLQSMN